MSLPLAGKLGLAQLGAAELGQLASAGLAGAGFPVIFSGGTAIEEKKKKKKKAKKRKPKRVKVRAAVPQQAERPKPGVPPSPTSVAPLELPPLQLSEPIRQAMAEAERGIQEAERKQRLKKQIAEEDELLLLVI